MVVPYRAGASALHDEPVRVRFRVAVYVTCPEGHLLVFDHRDVPGAGTQVPAGGIEPRERLTAAARREVREETGLRVTVVDVLGLAEGIDGLGRPAVTAFVHATGSDPRTLWEQPVTDGGGQVFVCRFLPLAEAAPLLVPDQRAFLHLLH